MDEPDELAELVAEVGTPGDVVVTNPSYHLGRLRAEQVVSTRRSAADRRDAYYRLELARGGALLTATGGALHPGLRLTPAPSGKHPRRSGRARSRVLFLCTGTAPARRWRRRSSNTSPTARSKPQAPAAMPDDLVSVRYVVNGVDAAIDFLLGGPASSAGRVSGNGVA